MGNVGEREVDSLRELGQGTGSRALGGGRRARRTGWSDCITKGDLGKRQEGCGS